VCVFWDLESARWSSDGCRVVATNATETVCQCSHLAAFALAMRPNADAVGVGVPAENGIFDRSVTMKIFKPFNCALKFANLIL